MIQSKYADIPIFSYASFSAAAEKTLIERLINKKNFKDIFVLRNLSYYPWVSIEEKNLIIKDLMVHFWQIPSRTTKQFMLIYRDFDTIFSILGIRGHYIHQFEVFMLGWYIISQIIKKKSFDLFKPYFKDQDDLFYSWLYTSSAHDFGYPFQKARKLTKRFSKLYKKIYFIELSNSFKNLLKDFNRVNYTELSKIRIKDAFNKNKELDIEEFIYEGINEIASTRKNADEILRILKEANNHGFISAKIFCKLYIEYLSKHNLWAKDKENQVKMIASAIALHAIPEEKLNFIKKINYHKNPLAYFLFIIDNLQEWHRTLMASDKWPSYNLVGFKFSDDNLILEYLLTHENWTGIMEKKVTEALQKKKDVIDAALQKKKIYKFNILIKYFSNTGIEFNQIQVRF